MATCGRHKLAERSLRFFVDQDYADEHTLLIYNNSDVPLKLDTSDMGSSIGLGEIEPGYPRVTFAKVGNKNITLMNKLPEIKYSNLGEIYTDALEKVPEDTDVIIHWDDDDIFLPNHITEGVNGLQKAVEEGKTAYKPAQSYYRHPGGIQLMSNTLEPSIFVLASHIREHGYGQTTTDQHLQWVNPLVYGKKIRVDDSGTPTLIYNWGDTDIPTFKTSGNAGHPNNFSNYRDFSRDHGDQVLIPWKKEEVQKYYNLIYVK
jgi:hypothetical protein